MPSGNVVTLACRGMFDDLAIWFAATDEISKYKLEAILPAILQSYPDYVTFTTPDPVNLPVPSPTYLAIHATCAKVAHFSGATQYIHKLKLEERLALDPEGAEMMKRGLEQLKASVCEAAAQRELESARR
ncbi:hypothetical protein H0H81_010607 [Sphagnurus paluster]|uniref:Uncharacterized protein n=1 Tax=Sphagnurus paluster TaxID=117069 RepID=A0A9P7GPE8_9AGAR|nr:hypothetical protein H0H81_010607 [Sphagnurus paluster]